jgi:signal transduction histidine kinase
MARQTPLTPPSAVPASPAPSAITPAAVPAAAGTPAGATPPPPGAVAGVPRVDERLLADTLEIVGEAALMCGPEGRIRLANPAGHAFFGRLMDRSLVGADITAALARLRPMSAGPEFEWRALLEPAVAAQYADGIEVRDAPLDDPAGRDALVRFGPCRDANGRLAGWLFFVTELTELRTAERSRDHALRFLSHDMRAPMASMLALLELREGHESALPQNTLIDLIDRYARRALGLAENFLLLARAQGRPYRLEPVDLYQCAHDAIDEAWTLARNKQIQLAAPPEGEELWVMAERQLITLSIGQLLHNAIAHGPAQSTVGIAIWSEPAAALPALLAVRDQGRGVPVEDREKLLRPRMHSALGTGRGGGPGLGLTFVETVLARHGGRLSIGDAPGGGAEFKLHLATCRE